MKDIKFPYETGEFYDEEDEDLIRTFEEGERESLPEPQRTQQIVAAKTAARKFLTKDKRINIRLNAHDLMHLKSKAAAEGIPYQTLLAGLIHKYISGEIRFL